jgi:hypothetical protein
MDASKNRLNLMANRLLVGLGDAGIGDGGAIWIF